MQFWEEYIYFRELVVEFVLTDCLYFVLLSIIDLRRCAKPQFSRRVVQVSEGQSISIDFCSSKPLISFVQSLIDYRS